MGADNQGDPPPSNMGTNLGNLHHIKMDCGGHPSSDPTCTDSSFHKDDTTGAWNSSFTSIQRKGWENVEETAYTEMK
jgi:hypothetical protein